MSRALTFFLVVITLGLALVLAWLGLATVPSNPLGWFLLITGLVYFFGVMVVYWFRRIQFWKPRAKGEAVKEERNDRSFWLIAAGMIAAFYGPPGEYLLLAAVLPRVVSMQIIGLFLVVLGSILFIWARGTLGHFYSGHVSVIEGQRLVQDGPYRLIRHPAYTGYLLLALGVALGYSSAIGLLAILGLLLPSLLYRINVEEKLLSEHFGEAHRRYADRTRRLLPGIW